MSEFARRVTLEVSIDGHDATDTLAPCVLEFSYTDHASGKADELQLTLHDREGKWQGDWRPQKGMTVKATLTAHDWFEQGEAVALPCGEFTIDEVEFSGPPDKVSIKAVSAALTAGLRDERKTRAWNATNLQKIAGQVAGEHKLELLYKGGEHTFTRIDQRNESDITFINRVASEHGMACKVHDGKLCLYDSEQAEQEEAALVIWRDARQSEEVLPFTARGWSFREQSSGTSYDKAVVSYADPQTGTTHQAEVCRGNVPQKKPGAEKTLRIERRVESAGGAARAGKAALRKKNEEESTSSIEIMGNPRMVAGVTVDLKGFGVFSGKFLVRSATHKVSGSGGYTTSVELARCNMTPDVRVVNVSDESIAQPPRPAQPEEPARPAAFAAQVARQVVEVARWAQRFQLAKKRLELRGSLGQQEHVMLCLPLIAEAEAARAHAEGRANDAQGWEYLHDMFLRWFGGPDNFSKLERDREDLYNNHLGNPFWIDWDWVMQFERARATYASFTAEPYSLEQPNHIFNTAARNSLGRILQREGMLRQNAQVDFDFIAVPWTHYKRYYHTLVSVPPYTVSSLPDMPDGLMAALEKFTLRALAAGYTRHLGDDRYEICIQRVGVFAHDIFQFAEDRDFLGNQLGGWSCATKKGARARVDGDFVWLNNSYFRTFSNTHHFGNNFVVLSQMYHVDIAQEVSYVYTCS